MFRLLVSNTLSNSGRAVITQSEVDTKDAKEKAKQFVEIWKNGQLEKCFDVGALDVHGEIYCDTEFSTLEWSPCEKKLLYIAEKKPEKVEPFFKVKAQGAKDDGVKHVKVFFLFIYLPLLLNIYLHNREVNMNFEKNGEKTWLEK